MPDLLLMNSSKIPIYHDRFVSSPNADACKMVLNVNLKITKRGPDQIITIDLEKKLWKTFFRIQLTTKGLPDTQILKLMLKTFSKTI